MSTTRSPAGREATFYGARLRDARVARMMTGSVLAERIGVSSASITKYEKSNGDPKPITVSRLAQVLSVEEAYFFRAPRQRSDAPFLYRSQSAATKRARESAEVRQGWHRELYDVATIGIRVPPPAIDDLGFGADPNAISYEDIEHCADAVRKSWGLGEGPIPNLVAMLEIKGCVVSRFAFGAEKLSAFSQSADRPMITLNADTTAAARARFDAAHELGHLILHRNVPAKVAATSQMHKLMESQAHRFGAAFLFPSSSFCDEVYSVAVDALVALKKRWNVSMQMMIHRALDLDLISHDKAEHAYRGISRLGYRRREPLDDEIPVEVPTVLAKAVKLSLERGLTTRAGLLFRLPVPAHEAAVLANLPIDYLASEDWGQIVRLSPIAETQPARPTDGATVLAFPGTTLPRK